MPTIQEQYQAQITPKYGNTTLSGPPEIKPRDYLIFANNAYQDTSTKIKDLPNGWEELEKPRASNYLNGYEATVFINPATKQIVIAHCGTDSTLDKGEYPSIVKGEIGNQLSSALAFLEKVKKKYPGFSISHTGHSLGGYITEAIAAKTHSTGVSFDSPGAGKTITNNFEKADASQVTAYVSDPNFVNSVGIVFGSRVGQVIKINQANSTVEGRFYDTTTHGIYDYMKQFFDSKTGQLRADCFPNAISKTKNTAVAKEEQKLEPSKDEMVLATDSLVGAGAIYVYTPRN